VGDPVAEADPTVLRVLAVTVDDVVTAIESNERRDAGALLRVTPPFSGRMRARIHLRDADADHDGPSSLHVSPERLVTSIPRFPTPDETEDELRSDPDVEYSPERHRERHRRAVETWRERVRDSIRETTTITTSGGTLEVRIVPLG
jgi:hypothetical protein